LQGISACLKPHQTVASQGWRNISLLAPPLTACADRMACSGGSSTSFAVKPLQRSVELSDYGVGLQLVLAVNVRPIAVQMAGGALLTA
jgi:hypothetical protein